MPYIPSLNKVAPVLRDWISPFLDSPSDPERALQDLRKPIEAMLAHLSIAAGVKLNLPNEVRIQKLRECELVPLEIAPYLQLWWQLSCLGAHYQNDRRNIKWTLHHQQVSIAVKICLDWFGQAFPSLVNQSHTWSELQNVVSSLPAIPLQDIVVPRRDALLEQLSTKQILILEGASWVGKTSIAASLVHNLSEQGFVPLVFHQNSFRSLRAIPDGLLGHSTRLSERRTFKLLIPKLHSYIATRLFEGESFVIWLDDPFGHRSYKGAGILDVFVIRRWLELNQRVGSLGRLNIILSTPTEYLETILNDDSLSPLAIENRQLFHNVNRLTWSLDDYDVEELNNVVKATALACDCSWANRPEIIELVSEYLSESMGTFLGLRSFCKTTRRLSDEEILNRLVSIEFLSDLHAELLSSSDELKRFLCLVLINERRASIQSEYGRIDDVSFGALCDLINTAPMPQGAEVWVGEDTVIQYSHCGPTFRHPDLLATVRDWVEDVGRPIFLNILDTIIFSNAPNVIPKLEAPHVICGFAQLVDDKITHKTHNFIFMENQQNLDVRNMIWSVVNNWQNIFNSELERAALGFLRVVSNNYKQYIRILLSELLDNWQDLSSKPRELTVGLIHEKWDEHNGTTFLSGFIRNHKTVQVSAQLGCSNSQQIMDRGQRYLKILKDRRKQTVFQSRVADQLFEQPGVKFSGQAVLEELRNVLRNSGTSDDHLARQLDDFIEGS